MSINVHVTSSQTPVMEIISDMDSDIVWDFFIHEEPRFSMKCDAVLKPGVVITVEPGIYLPGRFGVRIEDMIVVTEDGYRNLASSPKELICV